MAAVDPGMPITFVRTLKEEVSNYFTQQRFIARLTSFFGILSLLLASMGIYGVTGYNVGRRNNEIGVRIALGATRGNIVRLVLGDAIRLVLFGLLMGLPLAFAAGRLLGNQLYGTDPHDPPIMLGGALALGSSALVASAVPAFRTSRIAPFAPSDALRIDRSTSSIACPRRCQGQGASSEICGFDLHASTALFA